MANQNYYNVKHRQIYGCIQSFKSPYNLMFPMEIWWWRFESNFTACINIALPTPYSSKAQETKVVCTRGAHGPISIPAHNPVLKVSLLFLLLKRFSFVQGGVQCTSSVQGASVTSYATEPVVIYTQPPSLVRISALKTDIQPKRHYDFNRLHIVIYSLHLIVKGVSQ